MNFIQHIGKYVLLLQSVFKKPENWYMYYKETIRQMYDIGIGSLIIVIIINVFIGAVAAIQFAYQMSGGLIPKYYIGYIIRDMTIIEFAPTFTAMLLAGKVGSNMAAEIGGMRQKEHIDAMEIMGVNTAAYLILPKIIAAMITIPLLVSIGAFVSINGGFLASVPTGVLSSQDFVRGLNIFFVPFNVGMMFIKAGTFAFILTTVSCYQGYFVKGGSIELGKASTQAVVLSDILILVADYTLALMLVS